MKSTIIEKAKKIIKNRRYKAENQALSNKTLAYNDDKFKSLYQEYVNKMIENAKVNKFDDEVEKLKTALNKRLRSLDIGSIEPQYSCATCKDLGLTSDGKYCHCLIDEINKLLVQESGFIELEDFKDANLNLFSDESIMKKLYEKMQKWCNSKFEKTLICIAGQTGVGKTHLIRCMANELIKRHKLVLLTTSFAMHQDFVKSYACRDAIEKQNLITKYIDAEILFIDDLGTELRNKDVTINYLYQILNERKINRRPTIITTNLKMDEILSYYDERISSRIADKDNSICIYIEGEDLRLKNK